MCENLNIIDNKYDFKFQRKRRIIADRRHRTFISGFNKSINIWPGDIIYLTYTKNYFPFFFEGICLGLRKFKTPNASIILRNIISGIGIELIISYYYNRIYFLETNDHKRKRFFYTTAKIYYVRYGLNRASRIKH